MVNSVSLTREHLSMPEHPESFPVNALVPIPGTPMEDNEASMASELPAAIDLVISAGPISYPSPDDSHGTHCPSRNHNQTCCGTKHSQRAGASNVFHGRSQRRLYRGKDADDTL